MCRFGSGSTMLVALVALGPLLALAANVPDRVAAEEDPFALPPGLLIGAGTSALQTEGAWNIDGKAESAADHVFRQEKLDAMDFLDYHAHETAADSYHRFKEDIAMAAQLKLKLYRFSISWSRVLPTADASKPNPLGVQHYHDVIDEIIKNGMTPMATVYHFDHPQILEDQFKGWSSPKMVDKFEEYARFVFKTYPKVKLWTTLNEPNMYCVFFPSLFKTSGLYEPTDGDFYTCARHTILAHARAYRAFKELGNEGQVGCTVLIFHTRPNTTRPEDVYAAEAFNQMYSGQMVNPIVYGDYPELVKKLAGNKLLPFSDAEKKIITGATDFIGINSYYGLVATYVDPSTPLAPMLNILGSMRTDVPFITIAVDELAPGADQYALVAPTSIRDALLWAWQTWKLPLVITENGVSDTAGLHDQHRAVYFSAYLRALVRAVKDYDIKVLAYCAWSVVDSYEFSAAFTRPFGLVHVDYEGGTLKRTLKDSSSFWIELGQTGVVPLVTESSARAATSSLLLVAVAATLLRTFGL